MGSGTKRKKKDKPLIRRPENHTSDTPKPLETSDIVSIICKVSFEVKVTESDLTQEGVSVTLQREEDRFNVIIFGTCIGSLNKYHSHMVSRCSEFGIKYKGKIVKKEGGTYARFERSL